MSWSFMATGKPAAVLAKASTDLSRFKCTEPEETIKNQALGILDTALSAFPEGVAVKVEAWGSQLTDANAGKASNSLKLTIDPIYGFVE